MLYKLIVAIAVLPAFALPAFAQQNSFDHDMSNTIRIFDANGKSFVNPASDVAGSPFFTDKWTYGNVTLNNDARYAKRLLRLNLESQQVHYLSEDNTEMALPAGYVKEVSFIDSSRLPAASYYFQCGFPAIDNQNEKYLYRVTCKGKITVLESVSKRIIVEKNDFTGETTKQYRAYENYYLFVDGAMQRIKKDKTFLLTAMKGQANNVEAYANTNKLSYKSIDDIGKLVDYYNTLP